MILAKNFYQEVKPFELLLKSVAFNLTKSSADAEDLLQDTYFKACKSLSKYQEGTNLKAWMITIMKNTFITNYQRMVRRGTFVDTTDNLHYINSSDALIDNGVFGNFTMDDIQEAIQKLDEVYRTPFLMHFRGFKYHEIADKLQIPIGTVKNRIHIARKLLKEDLMVYKHKN